MNLSWGFGSGATHKASDPSDIIYTITDRGPNIKCKDSKKLIGMQICEKGKIFPVPSFDPTIFKWKIKNNKAILIKTIPLKTVNNKYVTGISNPLTNFPEIAYNIYGKKIKLNPNGLDTEAIAAMNDGTFWIGEEYGPSILHVDKNGKIIERLVPKNIAPELKNADYNIISALPNVLSKRHPNRGIESIAVSPNQKYLYFMLQSPLDNPNYAKSDAVRIYKLDLTNYKLTLYAYRLDNPLTFLKDNIKKRKKLKDVKISDMECIDNKGDIIIDERINKTCKLYEINLNKATPIPIKYANNIEKNEKLIPFVKKRLLFDSDNYQNFPSKIEGVAYIGNGYFILTNDNDFGIKNSLSQFKKIHLDIK